LHHGIVQQGISEEVTQDEIDFGAGRKAVVQVPDLESALIEVPARLSQSESQVDGDWRHIHAQIPHAPTRQPDGTSPAPTCQLQGVSSLREELLHVDERRRRWRLVE
jgi:hypothetical protein